MVWVLFLDCTQAQVETKILCLILVWWTGLGVHRSYIGLIMNQVVHKTWIIQYIHTYTYKVYTYCTVRSSKE